MYLNQWLDYHARRAARPALIEGRERRAITYAELRRRALRAAAWLRTQGVGAGDRVAVSSANRVEVIDLLFACARLGAVLVPLNTRLTLPEQARILGDAAPVVHLVEPGMAAPILPHVRQEALPTEGACVDPGIEALPPVDPEKPLLILYTGGTTGTPKGAVLTQRSLQWNAWNTIAGWGLQPDDRAPIFTPFFHTGGLNVLLTPLLCLGGTVVLPPAGSFEPSSTLDLIEETRCTLLFMVPTMYAMLRTAPSFHAWRLRTLRMLISGGAPCPEPLLEAYWSDGLPLRQGYGLTEAGPNNFGIDADSARERPGSVGMPLPHVQVQLRRIDGSEATVGESGELWLSGPHLMSGYWGRPRETAAVIVDGWLRTGDLARRDETGHYYICGRSKEMFISGGENVFPAEIESVLAAHPAVCEAAVVGVAHPKWGEVGHAFVVRRDGIEAAELASFCRERLAGYKVPKAFSFVDELPKSALGKVLKTQLTALVPA